MYFQREPLPLAHLPPLSSNTIFADLTLKFVTQHIKNVCINNNNNIPMVIRQGNENLHHYANRFTETMSDVTNLETNMTIHPYMSGLCPNSLCIINLTIQKVRTLSELYSQAML